MKTKNRLHRACLLCLLTLPLMATTCPDDYDDDESLPETDVTDIALTNLDNGGTRPVGVKDGRCPAGVYAIRIEPQFPDSVKAGVMYTLRSHITSVAISTVGTFDADHPAGSIVTQLFGLLPSGIANDAIYVRYLSGIYESNITAGNAIYAVLLTSPDEGDYQFKVSMHVTNDSTTHSFCAVTPVIHLYK